MPWIPTQHSECNLDIFANIHLLEKAPLLLTSLMEPEAAASRSRAPSKLSRHDPFPHASVSRSATIGFQRCISSMGQHNRIDNFSAIDAAPAFEPYPPCVILKIRKRLLHHASPATFTTHGLTSSIMSR